MAHYLNNKASIFVFKNKAHKQYIKSLFIQEPYYVAAGLFFGFPECCIDGFLNDDYNDQTKVKYPDGPYMGTGFVPCISCANSINKFSNWNSFQEKINIKRKNKYVFPIQEMCNSLDRFFYHLSKELEFDALKIAKKFNDSTIIKNVKEEIALEKKKHKENNLFLELVSKVYNNEKDIVNIIIENNILNQFINQKLIMEMIYLMLRGVEKESLYDVDNYRLYEELEDNLSVIMRGSDYTLENFKNIQQKMYYYCIDQASNSVNRLYSHKNKRSLK